MRNDQVARSSRNAAQHDRFQAKSINGGLSLNPIIQYCLPYKANGAASAFKIRVVSMNPKPQTPTQPLNQNGALRLSPSPYVPPRNDQDQPSTSQGSIRAAHTNFTIKSTQQSTDAAARCRLYPLRSGSNDHHTPRCFASLRVASLGYSSSTSTSSSDDKRQTRRQTHHHYTAMFGQASKPAGFGGFGTPAPAPAQGGFGCVACMPLLC